MRVASVQHDIVWEDKPANHRLVEEMITKAELPVGSFILLPELGDTGFSFNLDRIADDRSLTWGRDLARRTGCTLQAGYAERGSHGRGRNCASIISPAGEVVGTYRKVHPFSYGREIEHFSGGDRLIIRRCGDALLCPLICYDLRFPELWRLAAAAGTEVFTIGASWPDPRQSHWRALLIARAIENQAFVVACNRVGNDPHLSYSGGSIIVAPTGEVLAEAGDTPAVLSADLDLGSLREWRRTFPALGDLRKDLLGRIEIDQVPPDPADD